MFLFCSNAHVTQPATPSGIPSAAAPATDEAALDIELLSELMRLGLELARAFQARALACLQAGDLDKAGDAETRFSRLALGLRRAVALRARLRERTEQDAQAAEDRRDVRQDETNERRREAARGVGRAIAVTPDLDAGARERLTADLWTRLTGDVRVDADLADTALPIEALIRSLCRALGLPERSALAALRAPAPAESGAPQPEALRSMDGLVDGDEPKDPTWPPDGPARYWRFQHNRDGSTDGCPFWYDTVTETRLDRPPWKLPPDHPAARPAPPAGDSGRPPGYEAATAPPDPAPPDCVPSPDPGPPPDPAEAERRRRAAEARSFGLTLPDSS
jgi:hypothetical protein